MRAAVTGLRETSRSLGMSIGLILLACTATAIRAAPADPQPSSASTPTPSRDSKSSKADQPPEVIIEAPRQALENRVRTFVGELTRSRRFFPESVPRWVQPLCFLVAGMPRNYAQFVAARLSQVAASVGAPLRKGGCSRNTANFYVVFTPNPAATLKYLNWHPRLLFKDDATAPQIDRFLNSPKSQVARVWHNAEFLGRDGTPLTGMGTCGSPVDAPTNCDNMGGSRITLEAVQAFTQTLVVVNSTRLQGIQLGQISDYVAMAGLVEVDDDVNLGDAPSILRLFSASPDKRPEALTEWDRAFLKALYGTDQRNTQQRGQIVTMMVDEIAH
jgi:hypothetical protein